MPLRVSRDWGGLDVAGQLLGRLPGDGRDPCPAALGLPRLWRRSWPEPTHRRRTVVPRRMPTRAHCSDDPGPSRLPIAHAGVTWWEEVVPWLFAFLPTLTFAATGIRKGDVDVP